MRRIRTWALFASSCLLIGIAGAALPTSVAARCPTCNPQSFRFVGALYAPDIARSITIRLHESFQPRDGGGVFSHGTFTCRDTTNAACPGHRGLVELGDIVAGEEYSWAQITLPLEVFFKIRLLVSFPDGGTCQFDGLTPGSPLFDLPSIAGEYSCKDTSGMEIERHSFALERILPGGRVPRRSGP